MMRNERGFTLIELVIVILILGIMAAIAIPKFFNVSEDAKYSAVQGGVGGVRSAIANYYAKEAARAGTGVYPTLAQLTDGATAMDASVPDNPYCDSVTNGGIGDTCTNKKNVVASTATIGTAGCAGAADTAAAWCYNASNGKFWAATDDVDTTTAGYTTRLKENTF